MIKPQTLAAASDSWTSHEADVCRKRKWKRNLSFLYLWILAAGSGLSLWIGSTRFLELVGSVSSVTFILMGLRHFGLLRDSPKLTKPAPEFSGWRDGQWVGIPGMKPRASEPGAYFINLPEAPTETEESIRRHRIDGQMEYNEPEH